MITALVAVTVASRADSGFAMLYEGAVIGIFLGPAIWLCWRWLERGTEGRRGARVFNWVHARFASPADQMIWQGDLDGARSALPSFQPRTAWERFDYERLKAALEVSSGPMETMPSGVSAAASELDEKESQWAAAAIDVLEAMQAAREGRPWFPVLLRAEETAKADDILGPQRRYQAMAVLYRARLLGVTTTLMTIFALVSGIGPRGTFPL